MSDEWGREESAAASSQQDPTAGALLRQAREAAGLHVAALAVSLKVPVRKLEALEEDRYDLLTDSVFVRALASSVCRTLKIDPQPILERLPQTQAPRLVRDSDGINAPFRAPSDGAPPTWIDQLSRPVFLAVFALLLGALIILLLPIHRDTAPRTAQKPEVVETPAPPAPAPAPMVVQEAPAPAPPPVVAAAPAVTAASATVTVPAPAASAARPTASASVTVAKAASAPASSPVAAAKPASAPASASAPVIASAASAAASSPAAAASGIVVVRAKGPSWVEVTDAKGNVAIRKVLASGESAGASGALPLKVTIGRVDHTDVQVRGKPFDMGRYSKDNVARFEVK